MVDDTLEITGPLHGLGHNSHNAGYRVGLLDGYKRAVHILNDATAACEREYALDDAEGIAITVMVRTLASAMRARMAGVDEGFKIMGGGEDA